jgi:hypothetical protein
MNTAQIILLLAFAYAAIGLAFAFPFVFVWLSRVDPAASGAPLPLRLLLIPGVAALWPVMLRKWRATRRGEVRHDPD